MQYTVTYDISSGLVLEANEYRTDTIIVDISDSDYDGYASGQKQLFIENGSLVVVDEPMTVETRSAFYEAPSE